MLTLTIKVNVGMDEIIGVKECVAMSLEEYGGCEVTVVEYSNEKE